MATTAAPYGFIPISHTAGTPRTIRMSGGIASGQSGNIFKYQPVKLVAGYLSPVTASTDKIFGIFAGVSYGPVGAQPTDSPMWPTGQTYVDPNIVPMFVYVWPAWDPALRLKVQANGAVAQALMGSQFNVASVAGNTTTGLSQASVDAAGVTTTYQGQFFLSEFFEGPTSTPGDAYTDLIVSVAYPQVGPAGQNSIY
jgi:hypothetical protein